MDHVSKSHNFSAILRSCDAVGVLDAHVVAPREGLPLHHGSSAGTKKWVKVHRHRTIPDAVSVLRAGGFRLVAAHPGPDTRDYRDVDYTTPTAIVLGAELQGISAEARDAADISVSIPLEGMVRSLNVSVATALFLFEARRQREAAGMYDESRLPADELERRLFEWAYPSIAGKRRREGRPYPRLDEDGAIIRDPVDEARG
jgi:tRNA (guanosine-2'-O-)-methyltransferase